MSKIQWTDETWNPVRGCARVSAGCEHCYAERQAHRFSGPGGKYEGLTELGKHGPRWTGKVRTVPELLDAPLRWRRPRRVFVNSMSDLFHEDVPFEFVDQVFATMADASRHTFQILTKRPQRMLEYVSGENTRYTARRVFALTRGEAGKFDCDPYWPLDNVWLGVSIEDQKAADERIPLLLDTPAAIRFLSVEPLLCPIELGLADPAQCARYLAPRGIPCIHWVIVGGESGPRARWCSLEWIRSIINQCRTANVPCFVKQLGARPAVSGDEARSNHPTFKKLEFMRDRKGGDPSEWPEDLRVREMPEP